MPSSEGLPLCRQAAALTGSQGTELEFPQDVEEPLYPPPLSMDIAEGPDSYSGSEHASQLSADLDSNPEVTLDFILFADPDHNTEYTPDEEHPQSRPLGAAEGRQSPSGSCSAPPPLMTDPDKNTELFSRVREFCPENDFVFVAGVCKAWKRMWTASGRPPKTSVREALSTLARIKQQLNPQQPALDEVAIRCGGIFALTAREGNLEGLKFAVTLQHYREEWNFWKNIDSGVTAAAAARGSLEILRWAHETEG